MFRRFLHRLRREPHLFLPGVVAWGNGLWHRLKFRLLLKRVTIGRWFRVYGSFCIRGPGRVTIGDNAYVDGKTIKPVCLSTVLPKAEILIGANCGFNGTTVQCYDRVRIDDWSNIADAYIVDSPAHHLGPDRRDLTNYDVETAPVHIRRNVWVSTHVVILHGVTIGENSVIGAMSLVRHDVPPSVLAAGNPMKIIRSLNDDASAEQR